MTPLSLLIILVLAVVVLVLLLVKLKMHPVLGLFLTAILVGLATNQGPSWPDASSPWACRIPEP